MKRALIADDHPIFRNGIKLILTFDMEYAVDEADDGFQALKYVEEHQPDLAIVDIDLPGINGLDVIKDFRKRFPSLPIVAISALKEEVYGDRALKAGATLFVHKLAEKQDFIGFVKAAIAKHVYSTDSRNQDDMQTEKNAKQELYHKLSNREFEVCVLIASGKTVGEIAEELHLSKKTVSAQRANILQKLELENNAQIMHYAVKHHLVTII